MVWTYVFVGASGLARLGVLWSRPILASYGMGAKQALTVLNGGGAGHGDTDTEANGAERCASSAVHVRSKISDSICSQNLWRGLTIWCSVMSMIIHKLVGWHWGTENSGKHHNPGVILSRSPPMFSQSAPSWIWKWALIINGMKGPVSEREDATRAACISLANDTLKVPNAGNTGISACHRLSQESDAGVLIRFTDLSERNQWLMNAKNLKGKDISIAPDLPPVLRKLKTDILAQRKELSPPARKQSSVRYLRQWPFVKLAINDQQDLYPRISQTVIVKDLLGISPNLELPQGI